MTNDSCPQLASHATAASPVKRLQVEILQLSDHTRPPSTNLSPPAPMENMKNDSCPSQLAPHATAASPEKRLQVESLQLSDPLSPPSTESTIKDQSCLAQPDAIAAHERPLHNDQSPGTNLISSTTMLNLHVGIAQLIPDLPHKTQRVCQTGKRH